ncbi:hypothetical protein HYFRA_00013632 [Hymenoscyphus fraxineus]|uniref:NADH dehydrogenase subunit 5 n=1 Tax=Hymenoscyphus fraxineus TaxID=746836 RepID=A0A9N9LCA7_9HELO|nr:hypothetical protein HYFRA_00013632 [Hymenoscyphus fraxineus]
MYLAIITLPLLGSIVSGFFGRKVGVSGAQLITCTCVIVTTLLAMVAFFEFNSIYADTSFNRYMSHDPRGRVRGKRVYGDKLSNSGDILKVKVPSYSRKAVSMVISLNMSENEMDNRGSKSTILNSMVVKEQRVDGS